ncbi:MAG TPA: undecaprenyl-diphosphate phosphatase, partial [Candidatus Eisenbacteria bacterium]|nr:undecaprenyl-diphosphate phosphatase [Candidatus Eisenbacteria bacterium]
HPVTTWQALFIGLLQGATELFPVSSLGHAVLLPSILRWSFDQASPTFVPFLVLLHLGTATALLILYRHEWARIVAGFFRAAVRGRVEGPDERLAMLLALGTIPGGAIGLLLVQPLTRNFANPRVAAAMLIVNGGILLSAELLRRRSERAGVSREEQEHDFKDVGQIGVGAAAIVGLAQVLALVPGVSRSGVTITGGLLAGLRHQDAAKFSFLLATPIIAAAGLLEVPKLFQQSEPMSGGALALYVVAAVLAGAAAYASARFLIRYFKSGRLDPYGWYCVAAGAVGLVLLR